MAKAAEDPAKILISGAPDAGRLVVQPPTRLRKCIATVALSGTLPDKLEAAAAVGFDGVEIMEADLLTFDGSPADVRRICEGLGLAIDLYQPFRDFEAMPEPTAQPATWTARSENSMSCRRLGTDLVLVCSNTQPAAVDDDARAAATLRRWLSGLRAGACASVMRDCPGLATSGCGAMPGASCSKLPTRHWD